MLMIDRYAYTNKLSKYNPNHKGLIAITALALTIGLNNNYINLLVFLVMAILTTFIAKIPVKQYLKILAIPKGFLLISIISIVLSLSKDNNFIFSVKIYDYYLGISQENLNTSINLFTRSLGAISGSLFLGLTTPLNQLIKLLKKLKLPNIVVELIVLIYRFIFMFLEEAKQIYIAQKIRFGYAGRKNSYKSLSLLIKELFLRLILGYKQMQTSLECKLYRGEFKIGD